MDVAIQTALLAPLRRIHARLSCNLSLPTLMVVLALPGTRGDIVLRTKLDRQHVQNRLTYLLDLGLIRPKGTRGKQIYIAHGEMTAALQSLSPQS